MKLISGMHRSGTSLIARLAFEAEGDLGNPATFYPGDQWNPDGYFEQLDIHKINIPLVNGVWGKLSYFKLPSTETILARSEKLAPLIQKYGKKYQGKIIKETRFSLTLPAWIKHGAEVEKVLICLRNPAEVANSIKKRNKTILRHGLELWYIHNKRIIETIGDIPTWIVSYNDLLDEKTSFGELRSALSFLDLHLSDERITELKDQCIKTTMNHNSNINCSYPKKIEQLWRTLQEKHAKQLQN